MRTSGPFAAISRFEMMLSLAGQGEIPEAGRVELDRLQRQILIGPIMSNLDVQAKLRALKIALPSGPRADQADIEALDSLIAWIKKSSKLKSG